VFAIVFCAIVFFMPEFGGYFLEYNNFIPADPLETPAHIAPVWYFTPFYSILRAVTDDFIWMLAAGLVAYAGLLLAGVCSWTTKASIIGTTGMLLVGFFAFDSKVWGVVLM